MGMFDYITYQGKEYQTKSLDRTMTNYELRGNELWMETFDAEWIDDGGMFGGYIKKENFKWIFCQHISEKIVFYRLKDDRKTWEEYIAFVINGKVVELMENIDYEDA